MTKKTRQLILLACAVVFFIITPYIVLLSLGYRVDFKHFKIVATGGIYIKAMPQGVNITIDKTIKSTTSAFFNTTFQQNLLPGLHTILIQKDGYFDYQKSLPVQENQVTKLEHVTLLPRQVAFNVLEDAIDNFYITPDGKNAVIVKTNTTNITFETINLTTLQTRVLPLSLGGTRITELAWSNDSTKALIHSKGTYFLLQPFLATPKITALPLLTDAAQALFNPSDSRQIFYLKAGNLHSNQPFDSAQDKQINPLVKNVIAYQLDNNVIFYLAADGFLYRYDLYDKLLSTITTLTFPITPSHNYKILTYQNVILLKEDKNVFLLNKDTGAFESFYNPVTDVKTSPDGQKLVFYNDHEILYSLNSKPSTKIFLNRFSGQITDCYWLTNDYLLFNINGTITVSEIDVRGSINTVILPTNLPFPSTTAKAAAAPGQKIFFDQLDKKLYIEAQHALFASERLVP